MISAVVMVRFMASHVRQCDDVFVAAAFRFRRSARGKASRVQNVSCVAGRKARIGHVFPGIFALDDEAGHCLFPSVEAMALRAGQR